MTTFDPWFQVLRPKPDAKVRLFALPYAGGGASYFRTWNDLLPPTIELNAIQLPGREGRLREPLLRSARAVAERLSEAIRGRLDRPFLLYGHSMGALLAFELERILEATRAPRPEHLFVSGRAAPDCPITAAPIHDLPDPELIETVARRYQPIPAAILSEPELLELLLPTLRADLQIVEEYRATPEPRVAVPITAYGGRSDPLVSPAECAGWARHTEDRFTLTWVDGGHFFVNDLSTRASLVSAMVDSVSGLLSTSA
ncbi:MAG: thioesterase [Deltaproteobacteria bacterium]|nr:thioesterase [Deltaproteobacteria bacterium]